MNPNPNSGAEPRRDFLKGVLAGLGLAGAAAIPAAAGLRAYLSPLDQGGANAGVWVKVTGIQTLPEDGLPRKFPVFGDRANAWARQFNAPLGAVYLSRNAGKPPRAFNVLCPHAGCFLDYQPARNGFYCPCHNSLFGKDGLVNDPSSPSPRDMDELAVEIRNQNEVWVRFLNFKAGTASRIPV